MMLELSGAPGAGKSFVMAADIMPAHKDASGGPPIMISRDLATDARLWPTAVRALPSPLANAVKWRLLERWRRRNLQAFVSDNSALVDLVESHQQSRPDDSKRHEREVLDHWYKACADFTIAAEYPELVFVADEGLIHRVVQLFTSAAEPVPEQLIERYCSLIPLPEHVYLVDTPVDVCIERATVRGLWGPWTELDELAQFVTNSHRATQVAANVVTNRGANVTVVSNTTTRTVDR